MIELCVTWATHAMVTVVEWGTITGGAPLVTSLSVAKEVN